MLDWNGFQENRESWTRSVLLLVLFTLDGQIMQEHFYCVSERRVWSKRVFVAKKLMCTLNRMHLDINSEQILNARVRVTLFFMLQTTWTDPGVLKNFAPSLQSWTPQSIKPSWTAFWVYVALSTTRCVRTNALWLSTLSLAEETLCHKTSCCTMLWTSGNRKKENSKGSFLTAWVCSIQPRWGGKKCVQQRQKRLPLQIVTNNDVRLSCTFFYLLSKTSKLSNSLLPLVCLVT